MGQPKANLRDFHSGGYFGINSVRVSADQADDSWDLYGDDPGPGWGEPRSGLDRRQCRQCLSSGFTGTLPVLPPQQTQ